MKIAILSLPLRLNFGGILQEYALKRILEEEGHVVTVIDRRKNRDNLFVRIAAWIKWISIRSLKYFSFLRFIPRVAEECFKSKYMQPTTGLVNSDSAMSSLVRDNTFEGFVVGSDQIWRPKYSPNLHNYFLDFTTEMHDVKRISYAASFGVDHWEYTEAETERCASLLKRFDAISVREDSAVELCQNFLGAKAVQLIDPTLLLDKESYVKLAKKGNTHTNHDELFVFILDDNEDRKLIIDQASKILNYRPYLFRKYSKHLLKNALTGYSPSVEQWLKNFHDAKYVLTDSYHGTIFSLIFNKPFIAIANKNRGVSRFVSLLRMFNMENRLVYNSSDISEELINRPIDWKAINSTIQEKREEAYDFLSINLDKRQIEN